MAGVNNPPNLKPLIDNQSTTQSSELTAAEQAISAGVEVSKQAVSAKIDAAKASLETKANQTQQAVIDESTSIKSALAQSAVGGEAATNAARDLVISELTQQVNTLTTAVNAIPKSPIKSIQRGVTSSSKVNISPVNLSKAMLTVSVSSTYEEYTATVGEDYTLRYPRRLSVTGGARLSSANLIATFGDFENIAWEVIEYV